jgi:hypothetical protein
MLPTQLISSLFGQANQSGEKSTVVHTIIWLIGVVAVGVVCLIYFKAPSWVIAIFMLMMVAGCIFYGAVFWFCLRNNPDLLRSEKMVLKKLAIEKQYVGDSSSGVFEEKEIANSSRLLETSSNVKKDDGEDK